MELLYDIRYAMLPEAILTIFVLLIGVLTFTLKKEHQNLIFYVCCLALPLAVMSMLYMNFFPAQHAFYGSFTSNNFTLIFRSIILLGTAFTLFLSKDYVKSFGKSIGEFYFLLMTATLGAMFLCGANDLVMLFIALETLSIASFALVGYTKLDKLSNEASLKYLIYGAVATAVMLYGFSFIYGITGETNLTSIAAYLQNYELNAVLVVAFLLMMTGFGFKISAAPFHAWVPDVYQGAPIPIAAYLSVVSKTAAFGILIRVLYVLFADIPLFMIIIAVLAVITMTVGNFMAVAQKNIRRLMAYSSIAQAGYIMLGLVILSLESINAMIFYLITYLFMNFGAWAAIEIFAVITGKDNVDDYNGLSFKHRYFALGFAICLLSLAGIPITAGFFSKFYLFKSVAMAGYQYMPLLILALLNTIVALFYYMRIVKALYVQPESEIRHIDIVKAPFELRLTMFICVIGVIALGIFAAPLMQLL